jgi:hypothetical protein
MKKAHIPIKKEAFYRQEFNDRASILQIELYGEQKLRVVGRYRRRGCPGVISDTFEPPDRGYPEKAFSCRFFPFS